MLLDHLFNTLVTTFNSNPHQTDLDRQLDAFLLETNRIMRANRRTRLSLTTAKSNEIVQLEGVHYLLHEKGYGLTLGSHPLTETGPQVVSVRRLRDNEPYVGLCLRPREKPELLWW